MALPTGTITMDQVRIELGIAQAGVNLNLASIRALAGAGGSGTSISMSQLRGKSAYTPVAGAGVDAYEFVGTFNSPGTAYCYPSVNPSLGTGSYTYAWSFTSSGGCTLASATARTPTVSKYYNRYFTGTITAVLQCVISDGTSSITVSNIQAVMELEGI